MCVRVLALVSAVSRLVLAGRDYDRMTFSCFIIKGFLSVLASGTVLFTATLKRDRLQRTYRVWVFNKAALLACGGGGLAAHFTPPAMVPWTATL